MKKIIIKNAGITLVLINILATIPGWELTPIGKCIYFLFLGVSITFLLVYFDLLIIENLED